MVNVILQCFKQTVGRMRMEPACSELFTCDDSD